MNANIPSIMARTIVLAGLSLASLSPASAQLASQFGILDLTANGGINPNTGVAWQVGDQYRLAFYTAGKTPGTSNDPADYDNFATAEANLSTLGNGAITTSTGWTALVWVNTDPEQAQGAALSNPVVRAGLSDFTGGAVIGGAGVPVYVMNGTTCIARNNADINNSWSNPFDGDATLRLAAGSSNLDSNGNPVTAAQNVFYSPYLDQFGLGDSATVHGVDVITGGIFGSHVNAAGNITLAGFEDVTYSRGNTNANNTGRIWNRFTDATSTAKSVYAISPLLTVEAATAEAFLLKITPNSATPGNYDFEWESKEGFVYDLVSSTDLSTNPETWAVWQGNENLVPTAPLNTLSNVMGGGDARRFFAVVEKTPPPLLEEAFDAAGPGLPAGWVTVNATTIWQVGDPTGAGGLVDDDDTNCVGTNVVAGVYADEDATITLTSPAVAIPAGGATLTFRQYIDSDLANGEVGTVRLLDGSGTEIVEGDFPIGGIDGVETGWTDESFTLPPSAAGQNVKVVFEYELTTTSTTQYSGFYIDDVIFTGN